MATLTEHVAAVQAAIRAAYEDGYLFQGWSDIYLEETVHVDLMLIRNERGEDGVMRNVERAEIGTVWI